MVTESQATELINFFQKYTSALHTMVQDEKEKLNALVSNSLPRIEHAISVAQANTKQIENLEAKRLALQDSVACSDLTFSQLLEEIPDTYKDSMASLFRQIQNYVDQIKFTNNKSVKIARTNIIQLNPDALIPQPNSESVQTTNPYETVRNLQSASSATIFKAKI